MDKDIAGQGPLERPVRPRVWMVRRHDAPNYWIPFLHEPVDALKDPEREVVLLHWPEDIEAERERCAKVCDEARDAIWPYHAPEVLNAACTVCENLANRIRGVVA